MEKKKIDKLVKLLQELEEEQICFRGCPDCMNCNYGVNGCYGSVCAIKETIEGALLEK